MESTNKSTTKEELEIQIIKDIKDIKDIKNILDEDKLKDKLFRYEVASFSKLSTLGLFLPNS